jgi:hypothetical protein
MKARECKGGVGKERQRKASEGMHRKGMTRRTECKGRKGKARECEGRQWMGRQGKERNEMAREGKGITAALQALATRRKMHDLQFANDLCTQ